MGAGRPRKTEPGADAEDLKEMSPELAALVAKQRRLAGLAPEKIRHFIYRYEGLSANGKKFQVACVEDQTEPPEPHDIGVMLRRGGCYEILSKYWYRDAENKPATHSESWPVFYLGDDYERLPAATSTTSTAATPAGPVAAASDQLNMTFQFFEKIVESVVKLRGDTPVANPPDVIALQEALARNQRESDARVQRLTDEFNERLARLKKDTGPAAAASEITPTQADGWVDVGLKAAGGLKDVIDIFKTTAPGAEA